MLLNISQGTGSPSHKQDYPAAHICSAKAEKPRLAVICTLAQQQRSTQLMSLLLAFQDTILSKVPPTSGLFSRSCSSPQLLDVVCAQARSNPCPSISIDPQAPSPELNLCLNPFPECHWTPPLGHHDGHPKLSKSRTEFLIFPQNTCSPSSSLLMPSCSRK